MYQECSTVLIVTRFFNSVSLLLLVFKRGAREMLRSSESAPGRVQGPPLFERSPVSGAPAQIFICSMSVEEQHTVEVETELIDVIPGTCWPWTLVDGSLAVAGGAGTSRPAGAVAPACAATSACWAEASLSPRARGPPTGAPARSIRLASASAAIELGQPNYDRALTLAGDVPRLVKSPQN